MPTAEKLSAYEQITNRIVAALEAGTKPWIRPWRGASISSDGMVIPPWMPRNATTGRPYNGINVMLLLVAGGRYTDPRWLTFKQALAAGGAVKKGEKGTMITFWTTVQNKEDPKKKIPILRTYYVFNVEQCAPTDPSIPLKLKELPQVDPSTLTAEWRDARVKHAIETIKADGCGVSYGGDRAFYNIEQDFIRLPKLGDFSSEATASATVLHEITHATGHKSRNNREFGKRFGDEAYAFEELVAEIGAAYLMMECGVENEELPQHASYVASWLSILKADSKAVFTASREATRAAEWVAEKAGWRVVSIEEEEEEA